MEELVVDLHILVVDGTVEGDGDHHWQLAQLQLAPLHAWADRAQKLLATKDDIGKHLYLYVTRGHGAVGRAVTVGKKTGSLVTDISLQEI